MLFSYFFGKGEDLSALECGWTRCGTCSGSGRRACAAGAGGSCTAGNGDCAPSAAPSFYGRNRRIPMTLLELSAEYRASAEALRERALTLEHRLREYEWDAAVRVQLEDRIRLLRAMWRETRDLAVLCERYYDRGYRRNVKYTI